MPAQFLLVALIVFFACAVQSILGFGVALISMPLLVQVLDPITAAAFVAIYTVPLQLIIVWRYRHALHIRPFWRVILGLSISAPLGVLLIARLDSRILLTVFGIFLIAYALYGLLNLSLPRIRQPKWDFSVGILSGFMSGAYNTGGPPLVIYGTSLGWSPEQFRANLQVLFTVNSALVIATHIAAGHVDSLVTGYVLLSLPVIALGSLAGFWLSRYVDEAIFRKAVLIVLLIVGVRLLIP